LVYYDEKRLEALSKREFDALVAESLAYDDVLRKGGHLVAAQALQSIETATTIRRVGNGKLSMTDGPFAETKEQLGGFLLIEARDLNEAMQLASKIPSGCLGAIEVRPIRELSAA
jgi:hypothetical protein